MDASEGHHRPAGEAADAKWHKRTSSGLSCESHGSNGIGMSSPEGSTFACPTSQEGPGYQVEVPTVTTRRYAVIMVGLPARGKTFLAQKVSRYLAWLSHKSAVFNVQRMWREQLGVSCYPRVASVEIQVPSGGDSITSPTSVGRPSQTPPDANCPPQYIGADLFRRVFAANAVDDEYVKAIDHCVEKVSEFFASGGLVAFINDDFVTKISRDIVEERLAQIADQVLYIEVQRDDASNARFEDLKIGNAAEYGNAAASEEAKRDFSNRIEALRAVYEPVDNTKSFIRIVNGTHINLHQVRGYLPSRMTSFLMHLSPQNKVFCPIYFSRHGQSEYNLQDRLGGDPELTEKGRRDAIALKEFLKTVKEDLDRRAALGDPSAQKPMQLWTSQLKRTIATAKPSEEELGLQCLRWRNLNEIHAGVCENLTYAEVKQQYPVIHDFRKKNKYAFRYPDGESYQDLVARLEPVIMELENADRVVVVVAHQAVLRGLLAYFSGNNAEHSVHVEVPHRTVWRCTYDGTGFPNISEMTLPEVAEERREAPAAATAAVVV